MLIISNVTFITVYAILTMRYVVDIRTNVYFTTTSVWAQTPSFTK